MSGTRNGNCATLGIEYDRARGQGTPFFYFAYGVAIVEVEVLGLTGEHRVRRVDILHDVGDSLVPDIDVGQVEGAFVQGLGWLTGEEVLYRPDGAVLTVGSSTYKIPSVGDPAGGGGGARAVSGWGRGRSIDAHTYPLYTSMYKESP